MGRFDLRTRSGLISPIIQGLSSYIGVLDTYTNAAAAYSLRLLRVPYTGSAIRVRRSSDNTESDIGFNSLGALDTVSLLSFCGVGNGFVVTWYDQSGNGLNVTQSTAINQPQIVDKGMVVVSRSKPSMLFDATNDILLRTSPDTEALAMNIHSSVYVHQVGAIWSNVYSVIQRRQSNAGSPVNYAPLGRAGALDRLFYAWNGSFETNSTFQYALNTQYLENYIGNTTAGTGTMKLFRNNANVLTANNSIGTKNIPTNPVFTVGNWTSELTQKYVQEIIIWATDQSSNISAINTSLNSFYNVY